MENDGNKIYKISEHAKRRYVERIVCKENEREINIYLIDQDEKIISDINKMITYGTKIFSGQTQKDKKITDVYVSDC